MATIVKRGRRWLARVRRNGEESSRTFATKAEAQGWSAVIESEIARGVYAERIDRAQAEKITFAELIDQYLNEVSQLKKGVESERYRLNALKRQSWTQQRVTTINGKVLSRYRTERLTEVKPATVNRELSIIHHIFEIARKEWGVCIPVNPVRQIQRPKNGPGRERRLAPDEAERLLMALDAKDRRPDGTLDAGTRNIWVKPMVMFALETALRRGEILGLRWKDVDYPKQTVRLLDSKNGRSRLVPLSTKAVSILQTLPKSKSGKIFDTTGDAVKKAFVRAVTRADIENFHFHDLRHEAISRLFEKGLSIMEVPLLSGHLDLRMLKRYTHMQAAEVVRKLG